MFSKTDLQQLTDHGLSLDTVNQQIEHFKTGFPPTVLAAPALEGKGVTRLSTDEAAALVTYYEAHSARYELVKFVPASGAATRMFKTLFSFILDYTGSESDYQKMIADEGKGSVNTFFQKIGQFAFYEELKKAVVSKLGVSLEEAVANRQFVQILETLLNEDGMDYGSLPKGLLLFHTYMEKARTPVEEHMVEGAQYAQGADGTVKIHFTVSPDHLEKFQKHVAAVKSTYESTFGVRIAVSYSIQKPGTDTIAVDMQNEPFRNEDGSLLFRPAGHGALLENLNDLDADLVFLKNIDNVVPDHLKPTTVTYKKAIAGLLLKTYDELAVAKKEIKGAHGIEQGVALLERLGYKVPAGFHEMSEAAKESLLLAKLNRPLRVCGMVKSDGDPGGGPFWVAGTDGAVSLQVVETAQIDLKNVAQKEIFNRATHFNPVDLVCMLKNHDGSKFDLLQYRDMSTGFVTVKSKDGKDLKAQELPGLWNGSMADWNTLFVEVPAITFNPVKAVNDLLLKEHQPAT